MSDLTNSSSVHSAYHEWMVHSASLVRCVHLLRGLIAILACLPNALVIFLYWRASLGRPALVRTRINYAVVNLLICNLLYCTVLCVYSFLKRFANYTLTLVGPCLTMTWFTVWASFQPLWAMWLVTICRMVYFSQHDRLDRLADTRRLIRLRLALLIFDIIAASLIILDETEDAVETHCNYQLMLTNSTKYLIYSIFICFLLVIAAVCSFFFRWILRVNLLKRMETAENNNKISSPNLDKQTISIPPLVWEKPKLIVIAIIVSILFLLPRIAFFCHSNQFWLWSTLCPDLLVFVLPLAFLWTTKAFREELYLLISSVSTNRIQPTPSKIHAIENGLKFSGKE